MSGDVLRLPLIGRRNGRNGEVIAWTLVDAEDYERFQGVRLGFAPMKRGRHGYACIRTQSEGKQIIELLHRLILPPPPGMVIDHRNQDKLDNRRANLRHATVQQNNRNATHRIGQTGYRGVRLVRAGPRTRLKHDRYRVEINADHGPVYIGFYKTPLEAALAYDEAARKHHGEFAVLNFPNGQP